MINSLVQSFGLICDHPCFKLLAEGVVRRQKAHAHRISLNLQRMICNMALPGKQAGGARQRTVHSFIIRVEEEFI